jgi:putative ABC transport system substrate-binding protein
MSYGGDVISSYYLTRCLCSRILRGENAGDLAVQLSTKVQLFMNLRTIKAMAIEASAALAGRADEVAGR